MFKIKVLTIGKCKERWLELALVEYQKRVPLLRLEWLLAKDEKSLYLRSEKEDFYIALDPKGISFTSEEFSKEIFSLFEKKSHISFIIGGAEGLSEKIMSNAKASWSLSKLTFTHQMTRLILMEQIYRSFEIAKGSSYHK